MIRSDAESTFTILIRGEVLLRELIEDGPDAFAKQLRELLEAELKPLRELDWNKLRLVPIRIHEEKEAGQK